MKKSKSALALFMSAVMTVTIVSPDLFGNGVAKADSAESGNVLEISASDYSNVDDIKAAVLKGLVGDTAKVEDYDFYYDFTFDALSVGDFSPAIMLDDEKIAELYGSDSYITTAVTNFTDQAYDKLHSTLVDYVQTNDQVTQLADYYGATNEDIAEAIFPDGDEGKQKLAKVLEGSYKAAFDGYDSKTNKTSLAYIPFTVKGTKGEQEYNQLIGITIPAIGAGEWNVTLVNKATTEETTGTVSIEKQDAKLKVASIVKDGFVNYTGKGINVFDTAADTVQVYVGLENCANSSVKTLGSNADKVFVSVILPEGVDSYQFKYNAASLVSQEQEDQINEMLKDTDTEDVKEWLGDAEIEKEHIDTIVDTINNNPDQIVDVVTDMIANGDVTKDQLKDAYNSYLESLKNKDTSGSTSGNTGNTDNSENSGTDSSDNSGDSNGNNSGNTTVDSSLLNSLTAEQKAAINALLASQGSSKTVDELSDDEINQYLQLALASGTVASLEDTVASEEDDTDTTDDTNISVSDTIASMYAGQSIEDLCAIIDAQYPGMGNTIVKYINSYVSNGITDVELKINEYPSQVGTYFGAAFTFDSNYANSYETLVYCITDDSTADYTIKFNTNTVTVDGVDTLYASQDLDATSYTSTGAESNVNVNSYFIGKDLNGKGNAAEKILLALDVAISKTSNATAKDKLQAIRNQLANGTTPENALKAYAALIKYYNITSDDDVAIAFLNELAAEVIAGNYDLSNYGFYTSSDEVKSLRCGKFLQISVEATNTSYIAVPVYRVFTLKNDWLAAPEVKNVTCKNSTTNIVYWGTVDFATGYKVYRRLNQKGSKWSIIATVDGGDVDSYADTTAEAGTSYIYTVRATDGSLISKYEFGMASLLNPSIVNVGLSSGSAKTYTVTWSKVKGATGYIVYRRDNKAGSKWSKIDTVGADVTSYNDSTSSKNAQYIYTVRAIRDNADITAYSLYDFGLATLVNPTVTNAGYNLGTNLVNVTWSKVSGATGYIVYRRDYKAGSKWTKLATVNGNNTTHYTDTKAKFGSRYIYTVRALRNKGSVTAYSSYEFGISTLTTPKVKNAGASTISSKYTVTVTWSKVNDATGYAVYRRENKAGSSWTRVAVVNGINKTSYKDTKVSASKSYIYTVRAIRKTGSTSLYSAYEFGVSTLKTPSVSKITSSKSGNTVYWSKIAGANAYYIYRRLNKAGSKWSRVGTVNKGTTVKFTDKKAKSGTSYIYTVVASKTLNGVKVYSTYKFGKSIKTK